MEADPARRIYEVLEGVVMLYKLLPDGRRQVVELVSAGDLFGVSAQQVYDCAAETLTPTTIIAYERAQVETSSELRKVVTKSLARKLTALHDHAVTLGRKSALERVATFLMRFIPDRGGYNCIGPAEHGPDEKTIHLAMTRQEIADYLGLTIETVSRAFSELRRRGAIVIDRQDEVRITDVCGLCHLTGAH
jgi:CRP/FNR family transcriptional regulator